MLTVEGTTHLALAPDELWRRLNDASLLGAAIPGCEALIATGDGGFAATITFAVGAVRGRYDGTIRYGDATDPTRCTIVIAGQGTHGSIAGSGDLYLTPSGEGTDVAYVGQFEVRGRVAAAGARVLAGISRKLIVQTLTNLEDASREPAAPFRPFRRAH